MAFRIILEHEMKTFHIRSFCKVNLSLRVIKELRNGLHKIQSLVTFVNLFDIISIREIDSERDQIKFFGKFKYSRFKRFYFFENSFII